MHPVQVKLKLHVSFWLRKECEKIKLVLGLQPISTLVPKKWFHVPHPSNGQNMSKTTPFRRQKRRFLERFWFQEIWWRRLAELNNLYELIPPTGRRQFFVRGAVRGAWFCALYSYIGVMRSIFRTHFRPKIWSGPPKK